MIEIVAQLKCCDLFALRLTNHEFHKLIHENESTIVRKSLSQELDSIQRLSKPAECLSLDYLINIRHRLVDTRRLSSVLAARCCTQLKTRRPFNDEDGWREKKARKLEDRLMMGLFALDEFLAQFQQVVLRSLHQFEGCLAADFARLGFVLGLDQQQILETLPRESFVHILQAWRILEGVANSKHIHLHLEATEYPHTPVKVMIVLGGLDRFGQLISRPTPEERVQDLDAFNAELWQGQTWKPQRTLNAAPLHSIHHLAAPPKRISRADFPTAMLPTAPVKFVSRQKICEPSLMAVILRCKGTLNDVLPVDEYICEAIKEEGDPGYILLPWNRPGGPT